MCIFEFDLLNVELKVFFSTFMNVQIWDVQDCFWVEGRRGRWIAPSPRPPPLPLLSSPIANLLMPLGDIVWVNFRIESFENERFMAWSFFSLSSVWVWSIFLWELTKFVSILLRLKGLFPPLPLLCKSFSILRKIPKRWFVYVQLVTNSFWLLGSRNGKFCVHLANRSSPRWIRSSGRDTFVNCLEHYWCLLYLFFLRFVVSFHYMY